MPRVMLVEDDEIFRNTLSVLIESLGYQVIEARNGKEALAKLQTVEIELVVTDLLMPEKDGFEIIRYLRRMMPKLRVIAMSGGGRVGSALYLDVAEQLGADWTLAKPFSRSDLEPAMNMCCSLSGSMTE